MPTAEGGLAVSDLTGQAGSFRLGPVSLAIAPGQVLAALDIPAIHVTHDRDEALSISNDLAIITGRTTRPPARPARSPPPPPTPTPPACSAGPSSAPGTADRGNRHHRPAPPPRRRRATRHPRCGARLLPARRPDPRHAAPPARKPPPASPPQQRRSSPPGPSAHITLAADPPLTALLLHRDLQSLRPQPGEPITVTVPPAASASSPRHQTPPETTGAGARPCQPHATAAMRARPVGHPAGHARR